MKNTKLLALLCFITILSCKENKTEAQDLKQEKIINKKIVSADFKSNTENQKVQLIDVRTSKEFNEGHIKSAENIDFYSDNFYTLMGKLNKDEPLYIYCKSGGRSGKTATKLKELGFKEVYDLQGGILDWIKQNFSIEK